MTDGDVATYIALTGDRRPLHCASTFAHALGYRQHTINDWLVFHIVFGKTVGEISLNAVANLGYADGHFLSPVYPGDTLRVEKQGESMRDAIHAALIALGRELRQAQEARRRITKTPGARPEGSIKRIFRDGGYGFILLDRGRTAYFHRKSLHDALRFESLRPGMPVEVELEEGRDGLQASRVFPVGNRRGF